MCKQKYAGLEEPKRTRERSRGRKSRAQVGPGRRLLHAPRTRRGGGSDDLFVQTVKCRGSCERGPNAIAIDDDTEEEIELEDMPETGRITLFGLRSRARMDDVVAKAAARGGDVGLSMT